MSTQGCALVSEQRVFRGMLLQSKSVEEMVRGCLFPALLMIAQQGVATLTMLTEEYKLHCGIH